MRDYLEQHPRAPLYGAAAAVMILAAVQLWLPRFAFIAAIALLPLFLLCMWAWIFVVRQESGMRWKLGFIGVIGAVAAMPIFNAMGRSSDAFHAAQDCVLRSEAVRDALGEVQGFSLGLLDSWRMVRWYGTGGGNARFVGQIATADGSARGDVTLVRSEGRWFVTHLRVTRPSTSTSMELSSRDLRCPGDSSLR